MVAASISNGKAISNSNAKAVPDPVARVIDGAPSDPHDAAAISQAWDNGLTKYRGADMTGKYLIKDIRLGVGV